MRTMIVTCPHCNTKNRIPAEKTGETAKCGRCHLPLPSAESGTPEDILTLRCSQCRAKNRVPLSRLHSDAKCGRCGARLEHENLLNGRALMVSEADFDRTVLRSPLPVLLYGWAPWCGVCGSTGPMVEALARETKGKVRVVKLNIDANPNLAQRYDILSVPAFFIFDGGELKEHIPGAVPKHELMLKMGRYLL